MEELRPNAQRAKAAISFIWIMLALEIAGIFASVLQLWIYLGLDKGENVSEDMMMGGNFIQGSISLIYFAAYIVSIVLFIRWFRRAYYNLRIKTGPTEYSEGWAAGAWFVPIMNLFVPYRIMKELYERTDQYLLLEANEPYVDRLKTSNLTLWWTLWLIYGFLSNIVGKVVWRAETLPELINGEVLSMVSGVLFVPLCIVTVNVIRNYSETENLFNEVNQG
jgi:hypothetical protein